MRITVSIALLLLCCTFEVRADIYAYTDAEGVTHYSNVPDDARYELLLAAPVEPEAAESIALAPTLLARAADYDPIIEHAAAHAQVEPALLRAVIVVESGFNSRAVSKRGAVGLMQLMPATARRYGVRNPYDPGENIHAGARYLRDLKQRYGGDLTLVLAAYNAGEKAVEKHGRRIPPFAETRRYVPRVLGVYRTLLGQSRPT